MMEKRDQLPVAKQTRDTVRQSNAVLRQQNGLLGNNSLLRDYGNKVQDAGALEGRISTLKQTYNALVYESERLKRRWSNTVAGGKFDAANFVA